MICLVLLALLADPPMVVWASQPGDSFIDVENIGDIDSDGTDDLIAAGQASGLCCLSGLTGAVLWEAPEMTGITIAGALCAIPDVTGDGICDIALGTGSATHARSGADGDSIWTAEMGYPFRSISCSTGPPGTYPVVHATMWGSGGNTYFYAFDGEDGATLWSMGAWTDDFRIPVISDFSGNGWDEIGICHDRGYAMSGFCEVRDGLTNQLLYTTSTIYFGAMDLIDTPSYIIATRSWGGDISVWTEDMITGDTLYALDPAVIDPDTLKYVTGVTGGELPSPVVMGWYKTYHELELVYGLEGFFQSSIGYSSNIVLPVPYQESDSLWKLAVLTENMLYLTQPPDAAGPSCGLPSPPGRDICLLDSDEYPTQLAAVAMSGGTGPGVCVFATSWPVGVEEQVTAPVTPQFDIVSNPGASGIELQIYDAPLNAAVIDITGRKVATIRQTTPGVLFVPLPAGVYHIVAREEIHAALRAVVLP